MTCKSKLALWLAGGVAAGALLAACASDGAPATEVAAPMSARPEAAPGPAPAPKSALVQQLSAMKLDIPYKKYVLKNGLTLLVNEDHKTPTVYFNIWYHVASKNEPEGRSGFAHLFEHIMYQGSEHFDDDFFKATQKIGATNQNGSTSTDRTNYFQQVPKESLDAILWLESDRMGYLLPTLDKAKLDEQRGVVQNEKRQGDNAPYGLVQYRISEAIYPKGHPYAHSVIGSMADLDAASLDDVKEWFRTWYGPSNAVVVLSGDITPEEAKAKVEKYFGEIPPGPPVAKAKAWVAKRSGSQREEMTDRVAAPRIYKIWNVPEFDHPEGELLDVAAYALAGDKNARITKRLVHDEQVATNVIAGNGQSEIAGRFQIIVTAKPDADLAHIERVIDEEMQTLFRDGPTAAELEKVQVQTIADYVAQTERASSKAQLLATWETFSGRADGWKQSLKRIEEATPASVAASARKWLSDGDYTLTVKPYGDLEVAAKPADRSKMPTPGPVADVKFPDFKRATLSNGVKVLLAERHDTPMVSITLGVDQGYQADFAAQKQGVAGLTGNLLDEGTTTRTGLEIAEQLDRMGASVATGGGADASFVSMTALTPTLDSVIAIWADVLRNPSFTETDLKRLQAQQVQGLRQAQREPNAIAGRVMDRVMWGTNHPWGLAPTPESVASITRQDVVDHYKQRFGSNYASIIVVGDTTLEEITPKLESALKGWAATPAGKEIEVAVAPRPKKPVVYLVDRPGSVQSVIQVATPQGTRDWKDDQKLSTFNALFGGAFTSRINMNLREDKGWSYGARSAVTAGKGPRVFTISAPVQTDATKGALAEIRKELTEVAGRRPPTAAEFEAQRNAQVLGLGTRWEAASSVAGALQSIQDYDLPDDYYANLSTRLRGLTLSDMQAAARQLTPDQNHIWVIVGDRAKIEKGIRELNIGEIVPVDVNGEVVK